MFEFGSTTLSFIFDLLHLFFSPPRCLPRWGQSPLMIPPLHTLSSYLLQLFAISVAFLGFTVNIINVIVCLQMRASHKKPDSSKLLPF